MKHIPYAERMATIDGETHSWTEWCDMQEKTIEAVTSHMRRLNIPFETALARTGISRAARNGGAKTWGEVFEAIDGECRTRSEWCAIFDKEPRGVQTRMTRNDYTFEQALKMKRWHMNREQMEKPVTINGVTKTMRQWIADSGISARTVDMRLRRGMDVEKALTMPFGGNPKFENISVTMNGETHTVREWCLMNKTTMKYARELYEATGNVQFACMSRAERRKKLREMNEKYGKMPCENELATHPTKEVVEMCTNCQRPDCDSKITRCLMIKRAREETNAHKDVLYGG